MAALRIRDLDDGVRDRLRVRAARKCRSMEAAVREILTHAASGDRPGLVEACLGDSPGRMSVQGIAFDAGTVSG